MYWELNISKERTKDIEKVLNGLENRRGKQAKWLFISFFDDPNAGDIRDTLYNNNGNIEGSIESVVQEFDDKVKEYSRELFDEKVKKGMRAVINRNLNNNDDDENYKERFWYDEDMEELSIAMLKAREAFEDHFKENEIDSSRFKLELKGTILSVNFKPLRSTKMEFDPILTEEEE